jgi:hypothetical protein
MAARLRPLPRRSITYAANVVKPNRAAMVVAVWSSRRRAASRLPLARVSRLMADSDANVFASRSAGWRLPLAAVLAAAAKSPDQVRSRAACWA